VVQIVQTNRFVRVFPTTESPKHRTGEVHSPNKRFLKESESCWPGDFDHFSSSGNFTQTTIKNVAIGPSNRESKNHKSPLCFFVWANPALINAKVPQPIAYSLSMKTHTFFQIIPTHITTNISVGQMLQIAHIEKWTSEEVKNVRILQSGR
jgi:hypothetical protein